MRLRGAGGRTAASSSSPTSFASRSTTWAAEVTPLPIAAYSAVTSGRRSSVETT
ncbi:Uncharacterised protein [Mycobacteroides abscessus subsp. abscessus]|nr:Uncharacterised protein [Mycobacteroides abscessus subsp. abscessus]